MENPMNESTNSVEPALLAAIKENASTAVLVGAVLVIAGLLALFAPLVAGLSITIMVGVMLVIGGIGQCLLAFRAGAFGRAILMLVIGVLMTVAGSYMMSQPVAGLASITLMLVIYLVVAGLCEIIVALQLRPADGWGWAMFNGVITLLLGVMLWRQFPLSGAWALGVLFGIKMIFSGWTLIYIGRSVKQVVSDAGSVG
jgi:uncharacterized membrane protein HdeD (DUF308 family)